MDENLIKACAALFEEKRAEARRLLEIYKADDPTAIKTPIVLWVEAQLQPNREACLENLTRLVDTVGKDNDPYGRIAAEYLAQEARYQELLKPPRNRLSTRSSTN